MQDSPDCKEKCAGLWELSLIQIEAERSTPKECHPLYKEDLKILAGIYRSMDKDDKALEIEKILIDLPDK